MSQRYIRSTRTKSTSESTFMNKSSKARSVLKHFTQSEAKKHSKCNMTPSSKRKDPLPDPVSPGWSSAPHCLMDTNLTQYLQPNITPNITCDFDSSGLILNFLCPNWTFSPDYLGAKCSPSKTTYIEIIIATCGSNATAARILITSLVINIFPLSL